MSPYMEERGGVVLSATIDKFAYGTLRVTGDPEIRVQSFDYDTVAKDVVDAPLKYDGQLDLVKAVINRLNYHGPRQGLDFSLHNDAPPGSGLGGSSAMVVAMVALFRHWRHLPLAPYEVAELAHQIERVDLGLSGGKQDQFASVFGGFNFIEFHRHATIVNPLRIDPDVLNELDYNLLLCYTGHTRTSDPIIDTQIRNYVDRDTAAVSAMDHLKELTILLKNALLRGRLDDFGHLLHEAWLSKKQMSSLITTPALDELYEAARAAGALGGKINREPEAEATCSSIVRSGAATISRRRLNGRARRSSISASNSAASRRGACRTEDVAGPARPRTSELCRGRARGGPAAAVGLLSAARLDRSPPFSASCCWRTYGRSTGSSCWRVLARS